MKQAMIDEDLLDSDDLRETDESQSESDASPDEPGTTFSACSNHPQTLRHPKTDTFKTLC